MARQLVVILGAGASHDCVGDDERDVSARRKPPLVRNLFDAHYHDVLDRYPLAQAVAADLKPRLEVPEGESEAISLEDYLRAQLRDSTALHRRVQFWAVPLYLQDLLLECGKDYTNHADNFDRLVSELLHLERVTFITLNYDTIFDRVLGKYVDLSSEDGYIADPRAALVKLHGSVNWGRQIRDVDELSTELSWKDGYSAVSRLLAREDWRLDNRIQFLASAEAGLSAEQLRTAARADSRFFYPALSAPLGPDDQPTCPPNHVEALRTSLRPGSYGEGLHLLIIGYSCLDKTPLELIRKSGNRIRSITIVNGSKELGTAALHHLQQHLQELAPLADSSTTIYPGGFSQFATPHNLRSLVEGVGDAE